VSALRLAEKGYRVAVMEMGRRWTPENLAHQLVNTPLVLAAKPGPARFFQHEVLPACHILHGCAVGGGSITYACHPPASPNKVWDSGS